MKPPPTKAQYARAKRKIERFFIPPVFPCVVCGWPVPDKIDFCRCDNCHCDNPKHKDVEPR